MTMNRKTAYSQEEFENFMAIIEMGSWINAANITAITGWSDRKIRSMAEGSNGAVISGQLGYKATAKATKKEVDRCVNGLRSQADRMVARTMDILQVAA